VDNKILEMKNERKRQPHKNRLYTIAYNISLFVYGMVCTLMIPSSFKGHIVRGGGGGDGGDKLLRSGRGYRGRLSEICAVVLVVTSRTM
jgi:hypothetical protein